MAGTPSRTAMRRQAGEFAEQDSHAEEKRILRQVNHAVGGVFEGEIFGGSV